MTDQAQSDVTLNDGRTMPQLGLGMWRTPAEDAERVVAAALDAGYRAVDTASAYGNEEGVGRGLAGRDAFLTTKLWNDDQGYDAALRAFDASAKRLGRDSVDLYLIHWPAPGRGSSSTAGKPWCGSSGRGGRGRSASRTSPRPISSASSARPA